MNVEYFFPLLERSGPIGEQTMNIREKKGRLTCRWPVLLFYLFVVLFTKEDDWACGSKPFEREC